jgi:exosortase A
MASESPNSAELLTTPEPTLRSKRARPFAIFANAHLLLTLAILAATCALYAPSLGSLLPLWSDTVNHTYTHGYLVLGISLALLIARGQKLSEVPIGVSPFAVALLIPVAFGWLIGLRAPIQIVHQFALPIILWLAVYGFLGARIARLCALPIGYLYFAIPVWDHANDLLQSMSIQAVRALLRVTAIPAYFQGEYVEIPAGTFHIEDGCSGLHFLIVALALAVLHGEINRCSIAQRGKLVMLAIGCALISNWLRIYVIVLAGHLTDMQHYLVRVDHYYFGWLVFAVAMALFFVVGARWTVEQPTATTPARREVAAPRRGEVITRLVSSVVLCAAPVWFLIASAMPAPAAQLELPLGLAGWSGPEPLAVSSIRYPQADLEQHGRYVQADRIVDVHAAAYAEQVIGKKISGYSARFHAPDTQILATSTHVAGDGTAYREQHIRTSWGRPALVWTQYAVGARIFASPIAAQAWYGFASLTSMPLIHVVSIEAACIPDCERAQAELEQFSRLVSTNAPERSNASSADKR